LWKRIPDDVGRNWRKEAGHPFYLFVLAKFQIEACPKIGGPALHKKGGRVRCARISFKKFA
jgi:hypothetical protein